MRSFPSLLSTFIVYTPWASISKVPPYSPGFKASIFTSCLSPSGEIIIALPSISLCPSSSSAIISPLSPSLYVSTLKSVELEEGSIYEIAFNQSRTHSSVPSNSPVHIPSISLVHATTLPSPYCQLASIGSSLSLINATSALGLGVVAKYPSNWGNESILSSMGDEDTTAGWNVLFCT